MIDLRDEDDDDGQGHALGHDSYRVTDATKELPALRQSRCVFPLCSEPACRSDCDHIVPFARGGPTCARCNFAPRCRHRRRLKTDAGWRYSAVEPVVHRWSDPHGRQLVRDRDGTRDLTPRPGAAEPALTSA